MTAARTWARSHRLGTFLATAFAAVVLYRYGFGAAGLIAAFTCFVLVVLSVIDVETRRLPNRIVLPSAALVLAARLASDPGHWKMWLAAAVGAFAFFLVFALVFPGGLGMGDVKLALLLGAALGPEVPSALVLGTLAGAVAGLVLIAKGGGRARLRLIPYGPFLAFGGIVSMLLSAP